PPGSAAPAQKSLPKPPRKGLPAPPPGPGSVPNPPAPASNGHGAAASGNGHAAVASAVAADPEEAEWRQVFDDFVKAKQECGENTEGFTYEKFKQTLTKNRDALISRHGAKS